ncbi:MAG: hypothetical protein ACM3O8_10970 [Methylococcaceae bacterium]
MKKRISILATIAIVTLTTCEKEGKEGKEGIKSLFKISTISPNADCSNGGQKIESGLDKNRNSLLDDSEVESTSYICNGTNGSNGIDGINSLTNMTEVSASSVCEAGGFKIDVGLDKNRNNMLDASEIESTRYICNGISGGYDRQIMFKFSMVSNSFKDTVINSIQNSGSGLRLFNKNNYTKIDSAVFVAFDIKTATDCCSGSDVRKKVKIELFDLTNGQPILNSLIESDDIQKGSFARSKNFINDLPSGDIELGTRLIFDKKYFAGTSEMYLILYRGN